MIKHEIVDPIPYLTLHDFHLEDESRLIPCFTTKVQLHKAQPLRVSEEGVKSEKQADLMIGKSVYLPLYQLPVLAEHQVYCHESIGF